jgi:hypothetical protein
MRFLRTFLEVTGAWTIAVTVPVLSTMGEHPEHFFLTGVTRRDLVVFPFLLALGVPLLITALLEAIGLASSRVADGARAIVLGALVGLFAGQLASQLGASHSVLIGLCIAVAAAALLVERPALRAWPRLLSCVMPIALVLFVASPAGTLLRSGAHALPPQSTNGGSVVLIVFDELPLTTLVDARGRIDATRFPSFARLARRTTWHRDASTVAVTTPEAVPAILTGRYPRTETVAPIASSHPENLFSLLASTHELHVYEQFGMCEVGCGRTTTGSAVDRQSNLLSDALGVLRHRVGYERFDPWEFGPERGPLEVDRVRGFTQALGEFDGSPSVFFLHSILPHKPFQYLPSGERYVPGPIRFGRIQPGENQDTEYETDAAADLSLRKHLAQTMYTDALLGAMLDALDAADVWDRAAVVVTADHGEAFVANEPHRAVSDENLRDVAQVPLFVHVPGRAGGVIDDRPVETIDILPMLTDALDVELPFRIDGAAEGRVDRRVQTGLAKEPGPVPVAPLGEPLVADEESISLFAPPAFDALLGDRVTSSGECRGRVSIEAMAFAGDPPRYVVGAVEGIERPQHDLAFAVDGRVVGIATTFREEYGDASYGALLDPALVPDEATVDDVDVHVIANDTLTPVCRAS